MTIIEVKEKGNLNLYKVENKNVKVSRPFGTFVDNFYITDFISENSAIMAKASKARIKNNLFKAKSIYN